MRPGRRARDGGQVSARARPPSHRGQIVQVDVQRLAVPVGDVLLREMRREGGGVGGGGVAVAHDAGARPRLPSPIPHQLAQVLQVVRLGVQIVGQEGLELLWEGAGGGRRGHPPMRRAAPAAASAATHPSAARRRAWRRLLPGRGARWGRGAGCAALCRRARRSAGALGRRGMLGAMPTLLKENKVRPIRPSRASPRVSRGRSEADALPFSRTQHFGGATRRYTHASAACACDMTCADGVGAGW